MLPSGSLSLSNTDAMTLCPIIGSSLVVLGYGCLVTTIGSYGNICRICFANSLVYIAYRKYNICIAAAYSGWYIIETTRISQSLYSSCGSINVNIGKVRIGKCTKFRAYFKGCKGSNTYIFANFANFSPLCGATFMLIKAVSHKPQALHTTYCKTSVPLNAVWDHAHICPNILVPCRWQAGY